jgi:TetR/AcrR family transcriptional repressor of mexJK operon
VAPELTDRSRRKREAILETATELFLTREYAGTSMDEVAAAAGVSKQTVYKHFGDKESLFRAIALSSVQEVSGPLRARIAAVAEADDVEAALRELARSYLTAVVQPEVLRRRQLVIREAGRFPDVASAYHDGAPRLTIAALAEAFARLDERGELAVSEPSRAATHFAFLLVGEPLDTAMFRGVVPGRGPGELAETADEAVRVFLAAYRPERNSPGSDTAS